MKKTTLKLLILIAFIADCPIITTFIFVFGVVIAPPRAFSQPTLFRKFSSRFCAFYIKREKRVSRNVSLLMLHFQSIASHWRLKTSRIHTQSKILGCVIEKFQTSFMCVKKKYELVKTREKNC